jgi:hypothetical protein
MKLTARRLLGFHDHLVSSINFVIVYSHEAVLKASI